MTEDDHSSDELSHEGVLRKSGRYPWGSGETPNQRNRDFLAITEKLRKDGLSDVEIVKGLGLESTTQLRAARAIAKNEQRAALAATALRLKEKNLSNVAIGEKMGINESSVRALLDPALQQRNDVLGSTADMLKARLAEKGGYLDIGSGVENHLAISNTMLSTAVATLKEEGYRVHTVEVDQLGTGKKTKVKVLAPPGTEWKEVVNNKDQIGQVQTNYRDGKYEPIKPPVFVDAKRVGIRYAEQGGADADGVVYLRPGVKDIDLGGARYAQVRIAVGDSHYLKGMAMYKDDLPAGVDLVFNTNKSDTGNKLDAMKKINKLDDGKIDVDSPFGAIVTQRDYTDKDGSKKQSAINIVNEEGDWGKWSRSLSSQMLSKQSPVLAKEQLAKAHDRKKEELDEILALTNPAVKKKLLDAYADGTDSASVHLKAAALPRQATHVILPINGLKDTEIYAPNYNNGERVVLVRFPHGGKFEIPELVVNNRNTEAKKAMGQAKDAVGINSKVAARLSGADFDGDTVLVIPNDSRKVSTSPPLAGLKNFDPQRAYPAYEGMKPMTKRGKQKAMGDVSNLITDMTIRGANQADLARAVRHSMVVIDAEKHKLNYKQSAKDNGISELKRTYQNGPRSGASTLISRASSQTTVNARKPRSAKNGGPIDKATGKLMWEETGESYVIPAHTRVSPKTKKVTHVPEKTVIRQTKSKQMAEVSDARKLSSGTPMENIYADHANRLKGLANAARKVSVNTPGQRYSPSAKAAYATEVKELDAALNKALKNRPLERQAQLLANATLRAKMDARPDMEADQIKKIKGQALQDARNRVNAEKSRIEFTQSQWDAIQAGAISNNKLNDLLANADLDKVKELAMPRKNTVMDKATQARADRMLAAGHTQAEVASALGISTSTLNSSIGRKE